MSKSFKELFPKEYEEYKYYQNHSYILESCASIDDLVAILPDNVEGAKLDVKKAAYLDKDGNVKVGVGRHANWTHAQDLTGLYYELKDADLV